MAVPEDSLPMRKRDRLREVLYQIFGGLNVLMTSVGINFLFMGPGAIVWSYSSRHYRFFSNILQAMWIDGVSYGLPAPVLVISGDMPPMKQNLDDDVHSAIIISNHTVDYDWYCLWLLGRARGYHGVMKIILKDSLKHLPVFGWGMQYFEFIFLARDWSKDKHNLYKLLRSFVHDDMPLWLLLFPEGTTICKESLEKSSNFAKKSGRRVFDKHLLSPRTRGFDACLDAMKVGTPTVYDITMAYDSYSGEIVTNDMGYNRNIDVNIPTMLKLLSGERCPFVHFHIQQILYEDIDLHNTEKFLDDLWAAKYDRMERFTKLNKFAEEDTGGKAIHETVAINPTSAIIAWAAAILGSYWTYQLIKYHPYIFAIIFLPFAAYRTLCRLIDWDYGKFGEPLEASKASGKKEL
ncbi:hypothetical protein SARC_03601 [Sphaeroforma arctica JP610]|uniref:Phospholipid/glycerol acyltransferase domain-containing protein n=1 Tax=Sphaeroforma arctica JP610 TaxID=667725 RepID=A0A0L0G5H1_9EUKA|nr:hypothetical protein SARC_03601 [Sphaeroforma arctica JP610]KNC84179.1 hypothetical protein SARC_03601 [Sphaeroforma arctica JP610]|eukprot:XP_014158081.1 hypothetical protein SARC_03601 [Sphaeroforma arctica JP610]